MTTTMPGNLALLDDPVAQQLLGAPLLARVAYTWHDGTPRVVPMWFDWTGEQIVVASPPEAPKVDALKRHPVVTVTIDDTIWPYKALQIRGTARTEILRGVPPEYRNAAHRHFGPEQGEGWVELVGSMFEHFARISIQPEWAGILDFETRFPRELARRMGAA